MKIKIVVILLAVVCVGLAIALFATKKQGEDQHTADLNSIVDFSNQVVNANLKINDLNQVNLSLTNDLALSDQQLTQLSNNLAAAAVTLADSRAALASAQSQITDLSAHITDLQTQNQVLDQTAAELTNTIAQLNLQIEETRSQLATSATNNAFLQQELQKQMAEKAEIQHKFNDLAELNQQLKKMKTDLFVARRERWSQQTTPAKGAELLMSRAVTVTNAPSAPSDYGLNVEIGSDGSVKVIPPLGTPTNAPAH